MNVDPLPEGWSEVLLGEIGTCMKGSGITRSDMRDTGLACVRYGELYTHYESVIRRPITRINTLAASRARPIRRGDVLFAASGETAEEIGKCAVYLGEEPAFAGGDIIVLRPDQANPLFLGYSLNAEGVAAQKARRGQGDAVVHISSSNLAAISVPLPPPEEQRAIAEALSGVDELIEGLEKLIEKKRAVKQAAMQELLTGKTRLPGFGGHWQTRKLLELADVNPEQLGSKTSGRYAFNYISLEDVQAGKLLGSTRMVFKTAPSRARRIVAAGDVLMATVRPQLLAHLKFDGRLDRSVCSTGFAVLRARPNAAVPSLLFHHLFSTPMDRQLDRLLTGSNYPAINAAEVAQLLIDCPLEVEEQQAIGGVLDGLDDEMTALSARLAKTRDVKRGMMQQLLTGRTRLAGFGDPR